MPKLLRDTGSVSQILQLFIMDSASTTGAGKVGLAYNSSGLTAYFSRDTDSAPTAITLATMTLGTFTSGGFKEVHATNMPGVYQFCPPDACLATGAKSVVIMLKGADGMAPVPIEIDLQPGGVRLAPTGMDGVIPADPAAVLPILGTTNLPKWIGFFAAQSINPLEVSSSAVRLKDSTGLLDLATYSVSDDGTTFSITAGV